MLNNALLPLPHVPPNPLATPVSPAAEPAQTEGLFGQMLSDALGQVAGQQARANHLVEEHLLGHQVTDIEVLTAIKQADLTLKAMLQVRNKVVEAYKQLEQTQL